MYSESIFIHYEQLPDNYKQEANDFIEFLLSKIVNNKIADSKSRGGLGIAKGKYNMSEDFDEPLDDFKEYMERKNNTKINSDKIYKNEIN